MQLPLFNEINPQTIVQDLEKLLDKNRIELAQLLTEVTPLDWSFIEKIDDLSDQIDHFWSPINHLYAVNQTPELRAAYHQCLPKLSAYQTKLSQNHALYQAIQSLSRSEYPFNYAQEKYLQNELRNFHLSGVDLNEADKQRYAAIQARLTELSNQFEENLLDATAAWSYQVTDHQALSGLPDYVIASTAKTAEERKQTGHIFTLDYTCYFAVLTHADQRELREKLYKAHITRASDLGSPVDFDNSAILFEILQLRHEVSQLLGFANYAQNSLAANKMAKNVQEVIEFLEGLLKTARPKAQKEWQSLVDFAKDRDGLDHLQPWDILYYREKQREALFNIREDQLRAYFPVKQVLSGLFKLVNYLFGIQIQEVADVEVWHPSVRFFSITDDQQQIRGQFYLDLYARPNKREGAWMDDYQSRRRLADQTVQIPIAFLTCNFSAPCDKTQTALLNHEEVLTLFHEFGHGLQHMLTQIEYEGVSGINGVAWDAIELPSQFLEYFAWEKSVIDLISCHEKTRVSLPEDLVQKMYAAKNFQSGLQLLRQIELALFDFRLHAELDPTKGYPQIQQLLDQIRQHINITPTSECNRFQHGFSHIFAGGYAAGYYSYLWAEVLACDAFYAFKEKGIFNQEIGKLFLETILEQGGAIDAVDLFKMFRGRAPQIQPFLESLSIFS